MAKDVRVTVRHALEQFMPMVRSKTQLSKRKDLDDFLRGALPEREYWFLMIPFNQMDRQVFLHITPDIKIIVRMIYIKGKWVRSIPNIPESLSESIWSSKSYMARPS